MKTKISVLIVSTLFLGFIFFTSFSDSISSESAETAAFKYVGATTCAGSCHKSDSQGKQLDIWQNSKHSQAYKVLQTPEADAIAKEKGFTTPAVETPACLKCHVLGKEMDPAEFESTFNKEDGVQCETCHGPGSDYKKLSIMKDKELSKQNGLIIHTEKEEFCKSCHNSESPTFKSFNYEEAWAKIQHSKPKE
jgi:excinuclease UvrABC ATPase subunit